MKDGKRSAARCVLAEEEAVHLLYLCLDRMFQTAETARDQDIDGIHDLRVASRRLRGALKETALVYKKKALRRFAEQAAAITKSLGKARELDVSILLLRDIRPQLSGEVRRAATHTLYEMNRLRHASAPQVREACAVLESEVFSQLREALDASRHASKQCLLEHARKSIGKLHQQVHQAYARWEKQPTPEHLHQVRVCFKKLRYACECHEDLYGKPMSGFIKQLKKAQEALGAWNDLRVLRNYVAAASKESAALWPGAPDAFAYKELKNALIPRMNQMLQSFHADVNEFFQTDIHQKQAKLFASPQEHCLACPLFPEPKNLGDDHSESGDIVVHE